MYIIYIIITNILTTYVLPAASINSCVSGIEKCIFKKYNINILNLFYNQNTLYIIIKYNNNL